MAAGYLKDVPCGEKVSGLVIIRGNYNYYGKFKAKMVPFFIKINEILQTSIIRLGW